MRNAQQIREARERERARRLRARERAQNRTARAKAARQQRRDAERARAAQKKQRVIDARDSIKAGEDNLFNGVSALIHTLAQRALSNLRLSLGLRISWNYAAKLLSLMMRELLFAVLIFIAAEWIMLARDAQSFASRQDAVTLEFQINAGAECVRVESRVPGWEITLCPGTAQQEDRTLYRIARYTGGLTGVHAEDWIRVRATFFTDLADASGTLYLAQYQLLEHMALFYGVLGLIVTLNLISVLSFIVSGRYLNQKVLKPIGQITETAQMLSENDLGRRINVEGTNNELRDLALVINDMLDRIELAYNAQKQFVSDASHELRTPIAVIQGYASLLERWGKDSPEVRDEAIAAIVSESAAMKELVEKLLFLARHDKKTLKMRVERFDIREVVEETLRETRLIVNDHSVEAGELQSAQIDADRSSIKQALRIFVDNAVKYTPPGGTITVSCIKQGTDVRVSVSDTGAGISGSELSAIFERFYRSDAARSAETPGHGLGLSIAKIIVLSHKGRIRVRSKVGKGSTFTMELPRV